MQVIRAQDGALFQVDTARLSSLADLQHALDISIPLTALILMHSSGWQLDDNSFSQLLSGSTPNAAAPIQLFAFNRDHLDADPDELENELRLDKSQVLTEGVLPSYEPQDGAKGDYKRLAYRHTQMAGSHLATVQSLLTCLHLQRQALGVAIANLSRHQSSKSGGAEMFNLAATPQLEKQKALLDAYPLLIDLISRIRVLPALVASNTTSNSLIAPGLQDRRTSSDSNPQATTPPLLNHNRSTSAQQVTTTKERHLSDYVSKTKIDSVKEACWKVHHELQDRLAAMKEILDSVAAGSEQLQQDFEADNLDDLEDCERDSILSKERVDQISSVIHDLTDSEDEAIADAFAELVILETEFRERILYLIARKNAMTRNMIAMLQAIAALQSELTQIQTHIKQLDTDLRTKCENFKHLARLENMVPAYANTIVEIFRRKTYSRLLLQHSTDLANTLSKMTASEGKRRASFRSQVSGQLPWEIRGIDNSLEHVELEMRKGSTANAGDLTLPDVSQADVDAFIDLLHDIKDSVDPLQLSKHPVTQAIEVLNKSLSKLGSMQAEFANILASEDQSVDNDNDEVSRLQEAKERLERELQAERSNKETDLAGFDIQITDLKQQLENAKKISKTAQDSARDLENRCLQNDAMLEKLRTSRKSLEMQIDEERRQHAFTQDDAARQKEFIQHEHKLLFEEHSILQEKIKSLTTVHEQLMSSHRDLTTHHKEAKESLAQLQAESARKDAEMAALKTDLAWETSAHATSKIEKQEANKRIESLEEHVNRLNLLSKDQEQELRDLKTEYQLDRAGLEEQLEAVRLAQSEMETNSSRKVHDLLCEIEEGHKMKMKLERNLQEKSLVEEGYRNTFQGILATLKVLDESVTADTLPLLNMSLATSQSAQIVQKLEEATTSKLQANQALINRWHKECKFYRHKAKSAGNDKLAFKSFTKGDLCLFLPTAKTSSAKPIWAAFNSGVPHCFLRIDAEMEDLIRNKTFLVARIVNMASLVAGPRDTESNPYNVEPGMKFYIIDTEPFVSTSKNSSPAVTRRKSDVKTTPSEVADQVAPTKDESTQTLAEAAKASTSFEERHSPRTQALPMSTPQHQDGDLDAWSRMDSAALRASSPVFSDPDSPTRSLAGNRPSNLSRALSAIQEAPQATPSASRSMETSPTRAPMSDDVPLPPLSSSPSPAFLPTRSISTSNRLARSSQLTKSSTYPVRLATSKSRQPQDSVRSPAASNFTFASVGSGEAQQKSSKGSSASEGRRPSVTAQGHPTLSTSFVSSLGRTSGVKSKDDLSGMDNLKQSSASLELLSRFKDTVKSTTGSPVYVRK